MSTFPTRQLGRGSATVSAMSLWAMGAGSVSKTTSLILNFSSYRIGRRILRRRRGRGVKFWDTADVYGASLCTKNIEADEVSAEVQLLMFNWHQCSCAEIDPSIPFRVGLDSVLCGGQVSTKKGEFIARNLKRPPYYHDKFHSNMCPQGFIQPQIQSEHGLRTTNEFAAYELHVRPGRTYPTIHDIGGVCVVGRVHCQGVSRFKTLGYVVWSELNTVETDGGRSAQTPDMEDEIRGAQVHAHSASLWRVAPPVKIAPSGSKSHLWEFFAGGAIFFSWTSLLRILVQIYQITGGGLLFGNIRTHIQDDTAALCGGTPADWTAYFVSVLDKVRPRAYNPEAADALCAMRGEHLQRGGQTAEDVCGTLAGSILGQQGPDNEAQ
ncbi:hypothetical protein DFH09DRAFT_1102665 [Mycena vulgaris]|nr:hypothetical protein DFH09DRAFT_1102665 [Mycena vulgaris]